MRTKRNSLNTVGDINLKTGENLAEKHLRNDNVFVPSELVNLADVAPGFVGRQGYEQAVIVHSNICINPDKNDGMIPIFQPQKEIVNIVGSNYGHLPNENFFMELETKLIDANIAHVKRSINNKNRNFAVDYILNDKSFITKVKNSKDEIVPMIRLTNSYDGTGKTSGHLGFFRKLCKNGLHVAQTEISFKVKHTSQIQSVVMPEIAGLVAKFMDNEFYTLSRKFEVLAECALSANELENFVEIICKKTGVFTFAKSEKTGLLGINAQTVLDTITNEAAILQTTPNLWLGYNAINSLLFDKFDKSFDVAQSMDAKVFNAVLEMAN